MILLLYSIASGGITTFGSLIVKSFGYNSFTTILFNIPFGAMRTYYVPLLTSSPVDPVHSTFQTNCHFC